ncbi:MAG: STAS domain-containing protein [Armatimonadetes bacterium]|nr:STAS domain-containing protein [Armatimonadota bacterium]
MDLEIVVKKETGEIAEMLLRGRVDVQTAELLKTRISSLVEEGYRHILLNMRRVKFIDSVGLGSLIGARRRVVEASGSLRLVHLSPAVAKALEMTHLARVFDVHGNTQEAVAALARGA